VKLRLTILMQGHLRGIQSAGCWISWQAGEAVERSISTRYFIATYVIILEENKLLSFKTQMFPHMYFK